MDEASTKQTTPGELLTTCWRCHLPLAAELESCPHCAAPQRSAAVAAPASTPTGLARLLLAYCLLLVLNVLWGVARGQFAATEDAVPTLDIFFLQIAVLEVIDSLCIIGFYLWTMGGVLRPTSDFFRTVCSVACGLVGLVILLGLNLTYHRWLQTNLGGISQLVVLDQRWTTWLAVSVLICAQPAIFEEIFFRRMVLDSLLGVMSWHAAVWISALMFALAHLGVPLSIPYLFLLGAFLGYVRVGSGSLWLPIALHFLHNLLISMLLRGF